MKLKLLLFLLLGIFLPIGTSYAYDECVPYPNHELPCSHNGYDYDSLLVESSVNSFFFKAGKIYITGWEGTGSTVQAHKDVDWEVQDSILYAWGDWHPEFTELSSGDSQIFGKWLYTMEDELESTGKFELSYYFGLINEDWSQEDIGCDTAVKEYCGFATSSYAFVIQGFATSSENAWKYEYQMYDVDGGVLEPQSAFGKSTTYPTAQSIARSDPIIFPTQEKKVYLLNVCVGYQYEYPLAFGFAGTESICKSQFIGNGYTDEELGNLLFQLGKITSTSTVTSEPDVIDIWNQNECSDIGITEVFKGVKCALIWAFSPSQESLKKFNQAKTSVLTLYPIGYATLILSDVGTAFTSTSTTAFDKDIDVKKFFGQTGGTTTISVSNLTSELGMVEPIINYGEIVLWTLFVGWLLVWGLTRKL